MEFVGYGSPVEVVHVLVDMGYQSLRREDALVAGVRCETLLHPVPVMWFAGGFAAGSLSNEEKHWTQQKDADVKKSGAAVSMVSLDIASGIRFRMQLTSSTGSWLLVQSWDPAVVLADDSLPTSQEWSR